ncbi:hypothetical protein [Fontivita pretiosa]|uniref:hypothetical protein n=1 Tax=Fontivita pretiosa TaxID=2989684 RepID=UPI003D176714
MNSTALSESDKPFPPRYWWLKRLSLALAAALIALTIVRIIWGYDAQRRYDRAIQAIRARGEPILPEDFDAPHIPDDANRVHYLNLAISAINPNADPPAATNMAYPSYLPMSSEWMSVAKTAWEANQDALRYARQARSYTKVDWGVRFRSPVINQILTPLGHQRRLANLLGDMAVYQHIQGNDAQALELIQDLFAQADALREQPTLVSQLVAVGIDLLAAARLEVIAPGLRLADDPATAPTTQSVTPATHQQAKILISRLLDARRVGIAQAMLSERMLLADQMAVLTSRSLLLRPMYLMSVVQAFPIFDQVRAAATQPTNILAQQALPPALPIATGSTGFHQFPGSVFLPAFNRAIETQMCVRMEHHLAAVIVACRLYQVDHAGRWPEKLEDLVPDYLPDVPVDPFSQTGQPLKYLLARNGTRPIVYSVGEDGKDNTPDDSVLPPEPQSGWIRLGLDQWRDISRFTPPPQTQPAEQ